MWPSSLRPASPDLPGVGIDHQRHVGKPPPRRHTVRSATHSRFGAGGPNPALDNDQPETLRSGLRSWSRGFCLGWHRTDPVRPSAARRCSAHRDPLAVKRQPHLAGTVDPVVGGVDSRDLGLEGASDAEDVTTRPQIALGYTPERPASAGPSPPRRARYGGSPCRS